MPTTATTIVSEMTEATEQLMSIVSMLRSRDTLADAIVDVDLAAELLDPLSHASQPQAMRPGARIAAFAVVTDDQLEPARAQRELHVDACRPCVRDGIADQFAQQTRQSRPLHDRQRLVLVETARPFQLGMCSGQALGEVGLPFTGCV